MDKFQEPYWAPDLIEDEKFDSASSFNQSQDEDELIYLEGKYVND